MSLITTLIVLFLPLPAGEVTPTERSFRIDAKQFEYDPAILKVNPGDMVTIELVARDVVHGLSIDGYDLEMKADPGDPTRLSFIADREGAYRFRCSSTCGNLHPFMVGKLVVGQNETLWRSMAFTVVALIMGVIKARK